MASRLIQIDDGILVEAEVSADEARPISGDLAEKVAGSLDAVHPLLLKLCRPFANTWRELNREMQVEQAEVELGLGFEAEGNLYVTKAKGTAALTVKLVMKPLPQQQGQQHEEVAGSEKGDG